MYDKIIIVTYKFFLNLFRQFGKNLIVDIVGKNSRHFGHGLK